MARQGLSQEQTVLVNCLVISNFVANFLSEALWQDRASVLYNYSITNDIINTNEHDYTLEDFRLNSRSHHSLSSLV